MSEANGRGLNDGVVREIPDGLTTFKCGDTVFRLDLLATIRRRDEILKKAADEQKTHYDFLESLVLLVQEVGGPHMNLSQADNFNHTLNLTWAELKNGRDEQLKSLSSMDSTPGY